MLGPRSLLYHLKRSFQGRLKRNGKKLARLHGCCQEHLHQPKNHPRWWSHGNGSRLKIGQDRHRLYRSRSTPIQSCRLCLRSHPKDFVLELWCKFIFLYFQIDVVRTITELRAKHNQEDGSGKYFGIEGISGQIKNMKEEKIWEPVSVKQQVYKTAIESAAMLLRIDDVVSGIKKKDPKAAG